MAAVYLARHNQLGSLHAIKILTVPTPTVQARLLQEGRAQSTLRHSNVVAVTDLVEIGGSTGLVMEYVEGPSLYRLLQARRLDISHADYLARGILKGVSSAHAHGLVHRDLKPANILIALEEDRLVAKITDFGLTKVLGDLVPKGPNETRAGLPMGTPSYMAPEQIQDASRVDQRADVFALGAILYEMVCGQRAFLGADVVSTYNLIRAGSFTDPLMLAPELPQRMVDTLHEAMQVSPDHRIRDVPSMLDMWRGGTSVTDRPLERWEPPLLEQIRALGQEHTRSEPPLGHSLTHAASSETWADLDTPHPSGSIRPVSIAPAAAHRWPPSVAAITTAIAIVIALGVFWVRAPAQSMVLTSQGELRIHDDPVLQQEFDAGWKALLEADFDRSVRRLSVVVERAPEHPLPWLVHWRALRYADRNGDSLVSFWAAEQSASSHPGPHEALTRALVEVRKHSWEDAGHQVLDYLAEHPEDYFGRLAAIGVLPPNDDAQHEALMEQVRALDARPALLTHISASRSLNRADFERADAELAAGLSQHPTSPTLLALRGELLLQRGQFPEARDALIEALNHDPGLHLAQTRLGGVHVMLGEQENVEATTRQMMREATRLDHRVRYATYVSEILVGLGRYDDAKSLLHQAESAARARNEWISVITILGTEALYDLAADDSAGVTATTQELIEISHNPEIPDKERENLVRNLLYARGLSATRHGEVQEATEILERLNRLDRIWPQYTEYLEREIAIARGDAPAVTRLLASLPQTCAGDLERGHALWMAGAPEQAAPWIQKRIDDPSACSTVGETRLQIANGRLILAELAQGHHDWTQSAAHLDAFDALWPSPDPNLPMSKRARALHQTQDSAP
jgi:serine/threonine protein kinase/tetratricopeptide (TPR) repeat protein